MRISFGPQNAEFTLKKSRRFSIFLRYFSFLSNSRLLVLGHKTPNSRLKPFTAITVRRVALSKIKNLVRLILKEKWLTYWKRFLNARAFFKRNYHENKRVHKKCLGMPTERFQSFCTESNFPTWLSFCEHLGWTHYRNSRNNANTTFWNIMRL